MANEVLRSEISESIPANDVIPRIAGWQYPPDVLDLLVDVYPVAPGSGSTVVVPRFNAWAVPAGSKTEAADFARAPITTDGVTLTSAVIGGEMRFTREAQHDSRGAIPADAVAEAMRAMRARMLADALALVTGAGDTSDEYDNQGFGTSTIMAALRHAEDASIAGPLAMIISPRQAQQLRADLISDGSLLQASGVASTLFAGTAGLIGEVFGLALFVSPLVVEDGEGAHALLFSTAAGNRPIIRGVWDELHAESMTAGQAYSDDFWLVVRHAMALSRGTEASPGANAVEVISASP